MVVGKNDYNKIQLTLIEALKQRMMPQAELVTRIGG